MNLQKPKNSEYWKNDKKMTLFIAGDIIILCMCTSDIEWYKSFLSFWPFFALYPPPPLTTQKTKKIPEDIILLHMCNINQDHMMYSSWNIKCKGQSFFVIFYPLTLLTTQKNQNSEKVKKKQKKTEDIIILHLCTTNDDHRMYGSWDNKQDRVFCHLGLFFALLPPNNPENQKSWRYYHFKREYHKSKSYNVWSLRYGVQQT